jgi:hypothetical protein
MHDEEKWKEKHCGLVLGHQVVQTDMFGGNLSILDGCCANSPLYNEKFFKTIFKMSKKLFYA